MSVPYLQKSDVEREVAGRDGVIYTVRKLTYTDRVIPGNDQKEFWSIDVQAPGQGVSRSIGLNSAADVDAVLYGTGDVETDSFDTMGRPSKQKQTGIGLRQPDGTLKQAAKSPDDQTAPSDGGFRRDIGVSPGNHPAPGFGSPTGPTGTGQTNPAPATDVTPGEIGATGPVA